MKKIYTSKYLSVVLCLLLTVTLLPARSQSNTTSRDRDKFSIGFRAGLTFPTMVYSDPALSAYGSSTMAGGAIGMFAEIPFSKYLSFRPELMFVTKGQTIDNTSFYYEFRSNYFDWSLPLILNFSKPNTVRPYLMIAPVIGFASGGSIFMDNGYNTYSIEITNASIYEFDMSLMGGAGIKIPIKLGQSSIIAGAEVAYSVGLIDNYSQYEFDGTAIGLNQQNYAIEGTRKNRGLSMTLSLAIPFGGYKKEEKKPEPQKSLFAQEKESKVEPEKPKEVIKECYTIEEINALIDADKSVDNKVICMNNLNFEFNKSTLDKDSKTYLNNVVTLLNKVPSMKMKISGHTDNVGTDEYNMDLSKKRAAAVHDYLISKGISKERVSYEYFGATRPLVPNDSDASRAKNRRVEFAIIKK